MNQRPFQVWYYAVSHAHLLIRQPKNSADGANTDYFFTGVDYINCPTMMHDLTVKEADEADARRFLSALEAQTGKSFDHNRLYELYCREGCYQIAAVSMERAENRDELMDVSRYNPLREYPGYGLRTRPDETPQGG